MKDIAEAFASARASSTFVDSDLVDFDQGDDEEDEEDDEEQKDEVGDEDSKAAELTESQVKLVSVSKIGSKESVSDKERAKAGIMTTNRKVR